MHCSRALPVQVAVQRASANLLGCSCALVCHIVWLFCFYAPSTCRKGSRFISLTCHSRLLCRHHSFAPENFSTTHQFNEPQPSFGLAARSCTCIFGTAGPGVPESVPDANSSRSFMYICIYVHAYHIWLFQILPSMLELCHHRHAATARLSVEDSDCRGLKNYLCCGPMFPKSL